MGDEIKKENDDWSWLNQAVWRRWGLGALLAAASLAIYAALGSVLKDTAIHVARAVAEPTDADLSVPNHGFIFLAGYWSCFAFAILLAMYCAVLDIRFIRLQYTIAKRALVHENFQDRAVQEVLPPDADKTDR